MTVKDLADLASSTAAVAYGAESLQLASANHSSCFQFPYCISVLLLPTSFWYFLRWAVTCGVYHLNDILHTVNVPYMLWTDSLVTGRFSLPKIYSVPLSARAVFSGVYLVSLINLTYPTLSHILAQVYDSAWELHPMKWHMRQNSLLKQNYDLFNRQR